MSNRTEHAQRWIWFLDVVFGAIVALGIQKYEPVIREAWAHGAGCFILSLFVAIAVCSFVVYDIAIYHTLVKKYPYQLSALGYLRFYLDLIMAFVLYVLLVNAFQTAPDWRAILAAVSFWHLSAIAWHLLARHEHGTGGSGVSAVGPHLMFIAAYWSSAWLAGRLASQGTALDPAAVDRLVLIVVSATILAVSLFRWRQVIRQLSQESA